MNELKIILNDENEIKLNFGKITQITGRNEIFKRRIYNYISRYFKNQKKTTLLNYEIEIDGHLISSNHYFGIDFLDETAITKEINFSKDSLINDLIANVFDNVDSNSYVEQANDYLLRISTDLESKIENSLGLKANLNFEELNFSDLIKKSLFCEMSSLEDIESLSNLKKIEVLFKIIELKMHDSPKESLVSFWNIDNLLSKHELESFFKMCEEVGNKYPVNFIIFSRGNGFVYSEVDCGIESINVVNSRIFSYSNFTILKEFIQNNYPNNDTIDDSIVFTFINWCSTELMDINYIYKYSSFDVIIKLLNSYYGVECLTSEDKIISNMELNFLKS